MSTDNGAEQDSSRADGACFVRLRKQRESQARCKQAQLNGCSNTKKDLIKVILEQVEMYNIHICWQI